MSEDSIQASQQHLIPDFRYLFGSLQAVCKLKLKPGLITGARSDIGFQIAETAIWPAP